VTVGAVRMSPIVAAPLPAQSTPASGNGTLLPTPGTSTGEACNDAMTMLYTVMSEQGSLQMKNGETSVDAQRTARDAANEEENQALAREQKADGDGSKGFFASVGGLVHDVSSDVLKLHLVSAVRDADSDVVAAANSPNFWKDVEFGATKVAEVAAIVGSVAESVATFGAGSVGAVAVTALVLSSASMAESDCHVLERCGVSAKAAMYIDVGCSLAAAAVGGYGAATSSAEKLGTLATAAKAVGSAMQTADGAAAMVSGGAHIRNGYFAADAQDASADATHAEARQESIQQVMNMLLDGIKDASESNKRALQSLQGAMQTNAQSLVVAGGRIA